MVFQFCGVLIMARKFEITKTEYDRIRWHSYHLYSAIEEMDEDFKILYNTLEKIEKRYEKQKKIKKNSSSSI